MNESSCVFCRILKGEIPSEKVYEDDSSIVVRDVNPQAPFHVLVIPREHVQDIAGALRQENGEDRVGKLFNTSVRIAAEQGFGSSGFRLVVNSGTDGGQTVGHLHLHLMGGRQMTWPPG
ncbi:MAG: histidine triad nucleotide-binding protein [Leptospirales bacterium]